MQLSLDWLNPNRSNSKRLKAASNERAAKAMYVIIGHTERNDGATAFHMHHYDFIGCLHGVSHCLNEVLQCLFPRQYFIRGCGDVHVRQASRFLLLILGVLL